MRLLIVIFICATVFFGLPDFAGAQICPADSTQLCNPTNSTDFYSFFQKAFTMVTAILGVVTIAMIVYSGIRMVMAQGNEEAVTKAKGSLKWSLIGLIVTISGFVVVQVIRNFFGAKEISPDSGTVESPIGAVSVLDLFSLVFRNLTPVVAVFVILLIIINGYRYITAQGNDEQVAAAKSGLRWSIIGLVIIILAYVIVQATLSLFGHDLYSTGGRLGR